MFRFKLNKKIRNSGVLFGILVFVLCLVYCFSSKENDDIIVIKPTGGLCNRLRCIFRFLPVIKEENKRLVVLWIENGECPGFYLDYFEELENVTFIQNPTSEELKKYKIDYEGHGMNGKFRNKEAKYLECNYYDLKLKPYMIEQIEKNIEMLENDYIACHIRRTDHSSLAKKNNVYTSDKEFYDYIDNSKAKNVYVATDNRKTQDMMLSKYQGKIKVMKLIDENQGLRQTTLEDSIIDLFMCINAKEFKGSGWSSFSGTIDKIRKKNKIL